MFEVSSILALDSENAPALNQLGQSLPLTHPSERLGVHSAFNQPLRGPKIKSKSEAQGGTPEPPGAVVLRTVFRRCRGVPFKRRGSLGGCRLKNSFRNRGVQGGRGEGGKVNLPPYTCLIHAEGRRIFTPIVLKGQIRIWPVPAGWR